ncbi:MAG: hypothetical protein P8P33_03710 [Flavobacteriaceae bacterium]|nr:hypothetical protein [Flavobacteriaceae bacterium]
MKHYFKAILLLFFVTSMNGQSLQDILRYSTSDLNGTARYTAMGGAFGALGGDFGALDNNPAAGSVFEHTQFSITTSSIRNQTNASYFDSSYETKYSDSEFDQVGFALVLKNTVESPWSKISFTFNYQKTANFNDAFEADGYNSTGVDQYFLNSAQGYELSNFQIRSDENESDLYSYLGENIGFDAQQGFLGYQSFIIDAVVDESTNRAYISNVSPGTEGYTHEYVTQRSGGIKKYTLNFSGEYLNKYNVGININSHKLEYRQVNDFYEGNYAESSTLNAFRLNNELLSFGEGVSLQVGAIAKLNKQIRFGLSYESPTWFSITEETQEFVASNDGSNITIEPNVINTYPEYRFKTPSKYSGSFAYIFGQKGLISVDYTQVKYDKSQFNEPNDDSLNEQNDVIIQNVNAAGILRVGGEYRFGNYSIRAGYVNQGASLKNFDNSSSSKSIGGGINFGGSSLDLSIVSSEFNGQQQLFSTGLTDNIDLKKERFTVGLTYTLKL